MIASLLTALLIPPPPDWQPPRMTGPGLLCGNRYTLQLRPGETGTWEWPGEIFIRDIFSTVHVALPQGELVITENGPTTRPTGTGRRVGGSGDRGIRDHGAGVYSVAVPGGGAIRAVTLRFAQTFPEADRRAALERFSMAAPPNADCLQPENRTGTGG